MVENCVFISIDELCDQSAVWSVQRLVSKNLRILAYQTDFESKIEICLGISDFRILPMQDLPLFGFFTLPLFIEFLWRAQFQKEENLETIRQVLNLTSYFHFVFRYKFYNFFISEMDIRSTIFLVLFFHTTGTKKLNISNSR
jgi:hypothetical protein